MGMDVRLVSGRVNEWVIAGQPGDCELPTKLGSIIPLCIHTHGVQYMKCTDYVIYDTSIWNLQHYSINIRLVLDDLGQFPMCLCKLPTRIVIDMPNHGNIKVRFRSHISCRGYLDALAPTPLYQLRGNVEENRS